MSAPSRIFRPWSRIILGTKLNILTCSFRTNIESKFKRTAIIQCKRCYSQNTDSTFTAGKTKRQIPREKPAIPKREPGGGGYPLLVIPVICTGLGLWQIERRKEKLELIHDLETKMAGKPIPLPENLQELKEGNEYTKVTVRGQFEHDKELFIGPRSPISNVETAGGLASSSDAASKLGVMVVTPFKLADRPETILVNRGHVTFKKKPHQLRQEGQVEGEVEVVGFVRQSEKKSIFRDDLNEEGYWLVRNIEDMAKWAETEPIFIDADAKSTIQGGPLGGQTRVSIRNEHLSYIITWFSLAAFTYFLWWKNYRAATPAKRVMDIVKKQL